MIHVKFHDIGEGIAEGEVLKYLVKEGDRVKNDQPVVEVQTDKMTAELPSPAQGIVKEIKIREGENVSVGTTLLVIEPDEQTDQAQFQHTQSMPQSRSFDQNHFVSRSKRKMVKAAPYTRKVARELGVNIEEVEGTGRSGRITEEDVYRHKNERSKQNSKQTTIRESVEEETIPFKGRRKQIATKMVKSLYTIPHVTHFEEADVTNVLALTEELKEKGKHISMAAFFIKAVQLALKDFPIFNAVLDEEEGVIRLKKHYHIGIAVDTTEGLIVPVIDHTEAKSINQIHTEMKKLIQKAQKNDLNSSDIKGSTFTVSNVGPIGSIAATPIINYPEVGLLAFHQAKKRPAVFNDEIAIRSLMNMSMSFDHRVTDGATAIAFTNRIVQLIGEPGKMLIELA